MLCRRLSLGGWYRPLQRTSQESQQHLGRYFEDNSFGTHEFLNLCELLGCEPYVSMNIGSGTVRETADWVEYMTADNGPQAERRAANGRVAPWKVKFIGIGNEAWGCGGNMTPEYYSNEYRRYATYCHNFSGKPPLQDCLWCQRLRLRVDGVTRSMWEPCQWPFIALLHRAG